MNRPGVARAFAKALLSSSLEAGEGDAVRADILRLRAAYDASPELRAYCAGRRASTAAGREEMARALWSGAVGPRTLAVLLQMARWDAVPVLPLFLRDFLSLYDQATGRHVAKVAFAVPPTEADLAALRDKLSSLFQGETVEIVPEVRPALLAGFRLDVGDRTVDASLRSRLRRGFGHSQGD